MLNIGIVGHRPNRIPLDATTKVRKDLKHVVEIVRETATGTGFLQILGGRDEPPLAILTSLADGTDRIGADIALDCGYPLHVVLPMPRGEYERDFANETSCADFRNKLAAASRVIELGPPAADQDGRDRAYKMSADILLDHADLLVAVWDGAPPTGRGGTAMTIDDACARGMPVVVVDAKGGAMPKLIWHALKDGSLPAADPNMLPSALASDVLADVVRRILAPPLGEQGRHLNEFLELSGNEVDLTFNLEHSHKVADRSAAANAVRFRRAVAMNFVAAFVAIAAAVISLSQLASISKEAKLTFLSVEITCIALIVLNTWIGRRTELQRLWIDYREIAEKIRIAITLRRVGVRAYDNKGEVTRWVSWYVREQLRRAGLPALLFDVEGLRSAKTSLLSLAEGQSVYHSDAARRAQRAELRNDRIGRSAFVLAFIVAIVAAVSTLGDVKLPILAKIALGSLAIILPALGSALLGIRLLADYSGVEERCHHAAHVYAEIARHLQADPLDLRYLRARATEIAEIALGDVVTWRVSAASRKLDWPG